MSIEAWIEAKFYRDILVGFFFLVFCMISRYLARDDGKLKKGVVESTMFSWNVLRLTDAGNKKEYGGTKIDAEAGCAISLTYGRNKHLGMHSSGVVLFFFFFSLFSQQPYPPISKTRGTPDLSGLPFYSSNLFFYEPFLRYGKIFGSSVSPKSFTTSLHHDWL